MSKSIYVIAGEVSGDVLGARLLSALKAKNDFQYWGVGGEMMQREGVKSLFPMTDLSVMGVFEILPRLPLLIKRIHQTVADIVEKQPDIVVTIDSPDFCKRVVKRARKKCPNTKFIHYVAPTVWAWRSGRAKTMAKLFDGLICLFPFEPQYFEEEGLMARYCGHPIVETIPETVQERPNDHILVLPGSRVGEVKRMAPIFAEVYERMCVMNPDLKAHIVALPHVQSVIEKYFKGSSILYIPPENRFLSFQTAPFALATSGTAGLELAVAGCPHIIAYEMNPLTWWFIKRLVRVKYAHLVNIMEAKEVIPECLQEDCNADDIMGAVMNYKYPDLSSIRRKLSGAEENILPSHQAAHFIMEFV